MPTTSPVFNTNTVESVKYNIDTLPSPVFKMSMLLHRETQFFSFNYPLCKAKLPFAHKIVC